jgi:hypothetical protein
MTDVSADLSDIMKRTTIDGILKASLVAAREIEKARECAEQPSRKLKGN